MFNLDINKLKKNNRLDIQIETAIKEELIKIKKNIFGIEKQIYRGTIFDFPIIWPH